MRLCRIWDCIPIPSYKIALLLEASVADLGLLLALFGFTTRMVHPGRCPFEPLDNLRELLVASVCRERSSESKLGWLDSIMPYLSAWMCV